jgi:starch synthase
MTQKSLLLWRELWYADVEGVSSHVSFLNPNVTSPTDRHDAEHLPPSRSGFLRVLFVSSEIYPLTKTGGLADVSAALPRALAGLGVDVDLVTPGYPQALLAATGKVVRAEIPAADQAGATRLTESRMPDSGLTVWLVDCPSLFAREGSPYVDANGRDWPDNAQRFAHLSRVAAQLATGQLVPNWRADVVHANDWHTGLLPILADFSGEAAPATLFTIHNLAYQGVFPGSVLPMLGLPPEIFTPEGVEFHGFMSFLKAGIRLSDHVTTVSPAYAREILTPEHGCGLEGVLQNRAADLTGILNGIDHRIWDPARDAHLSASYRADDLSGKHLCKAELQRELGLESDPEVPLVVWISRITHQKMADILLDAMPALLARNMQFALLGQGDAVWEERIRDAARGCPERLSVQIGYEEALAHRMYAGGDVLLHPTRFEPCGLTPLYALRYGTLPVVRHVGGLLDTIVDVNDASVGTGAAVGFTFSQPTGDAMLACLDRALSLYAQPVMWRRLQRNAMSRDFSWDTSARRYLDLYRKLTSGKVSSRRRQDDMPLAGTPELNEVSRQPAA